MRGWGARSVRQGATVPPEVRAWTEQGASRALKRAALTDEGALWTKQLAAWTVEGAAIALSFFARMEQGALLLVQGAASALFGAGSALSRDGRAPWRAGPLSKRGRGALPRAVPPPSWTKAPPKRARPAPCSIRAKYKRARPPLSRAEPAPWRALAALCRGAGAPSPQISERLELFPELLVEHRRPRLERSLAPALRGEEMGAQIARPHRPRVAEVAALSGIGVAVVVRAEGVRGAVLDHPPGGRGHRGGAEAVQIEPGVGLGLRLVPGRIAQNRGGEAAAFHDRRHGEAQEIEDRRRDVDLLDLPLHGPASGAGDAHDQRHVEHLGMQGFSVLPAPVIEQLLAMVRDEDHGGVLPQAAPDEEVDQLAEGRVVGGDLGVVEVEQALAQLRRGRELAILQAAEDLHVGEDLLVDLRGEALPEGGRRGVGGVRLHGVEGEEERRVPRPPGLQPAGRRGVDVGRRAVPAGEELVGREPLPQAEAAGHVAVGHESGGLIPARLELLGRGERLLGELVPPAVDPVGAGEQAGEDRGGGRAGPGGLGHHMAGEDRLPGG